MKTLNAFAECARRKDCCCRVAGKRSGIPNGVTFVFAHPTKYTSVKKCLENFRTRPNWTASAELPYVQLWDIIRTYARDVAQKWLAVEMNFQNATS